MRIRHILFLLVGILSGCLYHVPQRYHSLATSSVPQLIFIKHQAQYPLLLDRFNKQHGAKAGWLTKLETDHWTVLQLPADTSFEISCRQEKIQGQWTAVPCEEAIKTYQRIANNNGKTNSISYIAENMPYEQALLKLHQAGFVW